MLAAFYNLIDGPYRQRLAALPTGPIEGIDPVTGTLFEEVARAIENGQGAAVLAPLKDQPENGAWAYLAAVVAARAGAYSEALTHVRIGNAAPTCVVALSKCPTIGACEALPVLRSLIHHADALVQESPDAAEALITQGIRIARAEPRSFLYLIAGTSMVMAVLKADGAAALRSDDRGRVAAADARAAEHRRWMNLAKAATARTMGRSFLTKGRVRRLAGITAKQMAAYYAGEAIDPEAKERFEQVCELEYRQERENVAPILLRMPVR